MTVGTAKAAAPNAEALELRRTLDDAGFDCRGSEIVTCVSPEGRDLIGYPQPFAVIIPPRFRPGGRLILHLHGWLENKPFDRTPRRILEYFDFPSLLNQSGVLDALFLLPFSQGKCETYKQSLADSLEKVLEDVTAVLRQPLPRSITLSGHSGAWTPIEAILGHAFREDAEPRVYGPRIDSVFLFDATYVGILPRDTAGFRGFAEAVAGKPQPRVSAVYRRNTITDFGARRLKRAIGPVFRSIERPRDSDHWGTVKDGFPTFLRELRD